MRASWSEQLVSSLELQGDSEGSCEMQNKVSEQCTKSHHIMYAIVHVHIQYSYYN